MSERRPRVKHIQSFAERLTNEAARLRQLAGALPAGDEQETLRSKAAQMESARNLDAWRWTTGAAKASH